MVISDLLRYKEQVESIPLDSLYDSTNNVVEQIKHAITFQYSNKENLSKLSVSGSLFVNQVKKFIDNELYSIEQQINSLIPKYLELSRTMSSTFYQEPISQRITHRPFNNQFEEFVIGLNAKFTDYRYAGCELFPTTEDYTKSLVAFEPLYLIDYNQHNLDIVVSRFNDQYKHKLRTYAVDLLSNTSNLPKNTIGHISAVNIFERFDIEMINQILTNLNTITAPGCSLLFTFNNCDHWRGAELVETGVACFQTERLLRAMLETNDYTDIRIHKFKENMVCLEARKIGTLKTIKHSSAIGKVVNISSLT